VSGPRRQGASPTPVARPEAGRVLAYTGEGWGVEPCPGCGEVPGPGEQRVTVSGVWRPWHAACWDASLL
jgi:hypothetical protein